MEDHEAAKAQAAVAREAGIVIHSLLYGGWSALFSDPDEAVVDKGLKSFENALRCANAMGVDNVLLVPQFTWSATATGSPGPVAAVAPVAETPGCGAKTATPARCPTTVSWSTAFGRCRSQATSSTGAWTAAHVASPSMAALM